MLGRWLQRGRIGQILAPDPNIQKQDEKAEQSEFAGGVWNVIAPDPNFTASTVSSPTDSRDVNKSSINNNNDNNNSHNRINDETMSSNHSGSDDYNDVDSDIFTPSKDQQQTPKTPSTPSSNDNIEKLVLSAAKDLATCVASPIAIWEDHKKLFNFCASTTSLSEKQLKRVKKMFKKDPSLAMVRASKMGNLVPDGFTPLHAAAYVGNYDVAVILIDLCVDNDEGDKDKNNNTDLDNHINDDDMNTKECKKEYIVSLDARDVQGRTPLHIASEQGHVNLVKLLKTKMSERDPNGIEPIGENAPVDLTGRTPLGWAATSREAMACKNINELRTELFSPGDKSVFGKKTPAKDRTGGGKRLNNSDGMDICYGFAEMPGHRIEMEDAICHEFPLSLNNVSQADNSSIEVGFFGVFDGHGDGGVASRYIADHIVQCLTSTQEWSEYDGNADVLAKALSKACCDIDVDLKAMVDGSNIKNGGSTGIMAIVTPKEIIVGNVGDSRCVLVQRQETKKNVDLSEALEKKLVLEESDEESKSQTTTQSHVEVKAMSDDHKPNLPEEKLRIEKAGLEVIKETFQIEENGEETSIWKIKSSKGKIAVSRAFGDFDFKSNEDFKFEEQAIISVPEIKIHERDQHRDMYLVLACDGVFDVMSNDEVGAFVAARAEERKQNTTNTDFAELLPEVGDDLLKHCLDIGSSDNMTVLIVALPTNTNVLIKDGITRKVLFADV